MRLSTHGDRHEKRYWRAFVAERFPSYERFWLVNVVPVTRRALDPEDIRFLSRQDLGGERDEDVAVAQLHYTALRHVGRVHDLLQVETPPYTKRLVARPGPGSAVAEAEATSASEVRYSGGSATYQDAARVSVHGARNAFGFDAFTEAFVRLAAATDVADEILRRRSMPQTYPPWDEKQGRKAREDWRKLRGDPLKDIRDYRNRLVHGRVVPSLEDDDGHSWYPRVSKVNEYLDWRPVQEPTRPEINRDFDAGDVIVSEVWDRVVDYLETNWRTHLIGSA